MSWANQYIKLLLEGKKISFRPKGNSMQPKINSGQLVFVRPINEDDNLKINDIVLCKVKGKHYLHLISAISSDNKRYQISNNKNFVNGWITIGQIYGILTHVEK